MAGNSTISTLPGQCPGWTFVDMVMRTYSARPEHIDKKWILLDAEDVVLGRLASYIALKLRGKDKAIFTPHMDTGDNVIVINAAKVRLTGRKLQDKTYYRHTGYPGGIRERRAGDVLAGRFPERVIRDAVKRMLPANRLSRQLMRNLRIYAGPEHGHAAQNPVMIDFAARNAKNMRSNSQ